MRRLCLPMSSTEVFGYQGIASWISDDGTDGFNNELMHYDENTRSLIRLC